MSKRPSEEQITKEIYTHHDGDEEDDDVSKMGDFQKASSDALARRPMKALRRIGSLARTISDVDDSGTKRTVLFNEDMSSSPGSRPDPSSSNQPSESRPSVPELAKSFSAPVSSSTTINPATSTRPNLFSQASFTFNIGSSVTLPPGSLIPTNIPVDADSPKINEEGYEKALRGVNTTFMKRIQKELELNAIINLAHTFQQYIDHRVAIKKQFQGIAEPKPIVLSKDSEARSLSANDVRVKRSEGFRSKNDDRTSSTYTTSSSGPQDSRASSTGSTSTASGNPMRKLDFGFGLPLNKIASAETIKSGEGLGGGSSISSAPGGLGTGSFGFGSSSIKGVVDPSRNPTGSVALGGGWSIGVGSPLDIDGNQTNFQRHGGAPSTPSIRSASFPGPSDSSMLSPMAASSLRAAAMSSRALGSPRPMTSNMRLFSTNTGGLSTALSSTTSSSTPSENQSKFSFKPPSHTQLPKTTPFVLSTGGSNSESAAAMARAFARVPSQETLIAGARKLQFNPATETGLGLGGGSGLGGLGDGLGSLPAHTKSVEDDEEGEQTVYEIRAKLFVLDKDEYRDQGIGRFRVREDMQSKKRRMMMRTDSTGLVSLNSWIIHSRSLSPPTEDGVEGAQQQQLVPRQDKKSVIFFAMEDSRPKQFLLRVKTEQDAAELLKALL
ncbi:hypothetical protein BGZ92_007835 [Podila epicladia]|nr:hypothetical protein BGZ92_007835 [Podila epicladia]